MLSLSLSIGAYFHTKEDKCDVKYIDNCSGFPVKYKDIKKIFASKCIAINRCTFFLLMQQTNTIQFYSYREKVCLILI